MNRILIALTVVLFFGMSLLALSGSAQSDHKIVNHAGDTPTDLRHEPVTEGQRVRSRVFAKQESRNMNRSLLDTIDSGGGGVILEIPEREPNRAYYSRSLSQFLADLYKESDIVVIGRVIDKRSDFTADNRWICTDYKIRIAEVLKQGSLNPPDADAVLNVVSPSGTVVLEGRELYALDQSYLPLEVGGRQFLLFLRYSTELDAYVPLDRYGSFRLDGETVTPMTKEELPLHFGPDARAPSRTSTQLIELVRSFQLDIPHEEVSTPNL